MKALIAIALATVLAACNHTNPPTVIKTEIIKVPARYMICKGVSGSELPVSIENLTDQQVSDVIALLYGKLIYCENNMDAVRRFVNSDASQPTQ